MNSLKALLTRKEISYETIDGGGIATAFATTLSDGTEQSFSLFILPIEDGFGDKYIRFTLVPFVEQPYDGFPQELFITLLQINHDLPQLKFAFDADGDLELVLDVQPADVTDDRFDHTFQVIADYAGAFYPEIRQSILP
mgnify:CR=1 FL=1